MGRGKGKGVREGGRHLEVCRWGVLPTGCVADGVCHAADVKGSCGRLRLRCSLRELETQVGKAGARIRN